MNGKKILDRLIILFLVINLILLACISIRRETQYKLSKTRIDNIVELLAEKNIMIKGQLPRDFAPRVAGTLSYTGDNVTIRNDVAKVFFGNNLTGVTRSTENSEEYAGAKVYCFTKGQEQLAFDKEKITYTNEGIEASNAKLSNKEAKVKAETFIKRLGVGKLYKKAYVDIKEEGNKMIVTYFPTFEGIPIYDLYIQMNIYEKGIESATIYLGEVTSGNEDKQRITPIDLVLFGLEEYIPLEGNRIIKEITLGYKILESRGGNLWGEQIVPMYKIEVDGLEKPLFVNAYTNEIVK